MPAEGMSLSMHTKPAIVAIQYGPSKVSGEAYDGDKKKYQDWITHIDYLIHINPNYFTNKFDKINDKINFVKFVHKII